MVSVSWIISRKALVGHLGKTKQDSVGPKRCTVLCQVGGSWDRRNDVKMGDLVYVFLEIFFNFSL